MYVCTCMLVFGGARTYLCMYVCTCGVRACVRMYEHLGWLYLDFCKRFEYFGDLNAFQSWQIFALDCVIVKNCLACIVAS